MELKNCDFNAFSKNLFATIQLPKMFTFKNVKFRTHSRNAFKKVLEIINLCPNIWYKVFK